MSGDMARCADDECIHRYRCLRWLHRNDAHARSFIATCRGTESEDGMPYRLLLVESGTEEDHAL